MIEFTIPGEPKAKARPRLGKGHTYTPTDTVNYENYVKLCYMQTNGKEWLDEKTISAKIDANFAIPKSTSKKNRALMLEGKIRPTKKPDIDNIAKIIFDSLNGIAYKDDSQIVSCIIEKFYWTEPSVDVFLSEII